MRAVLLLVAVLLGGAAPAEPDWPALLRRDAQALHDDVAANHPGMVDRLNPAFARSNDAGLALALRRASQVRDYPGYWYALSGYVAGFDDGHMAIAPRPEAPPLAARWPGFLTGFAPDGSQRVMSAAADSPVPLGAQLLACDGRRADALAAASVGAFRGLWNLAAVRQRAGGGLFLDRGNPFVRRLARCLFSVDGRRRHVDLVWRTLPEAEIAPRLADTSQRVAPPFGLRTLADGTRWFSMPSFNGSPSSEAGKALPALIAQLRAERGALAQAPAIVLDVRGNGGGSSDWSRQIAAVLWGEAAVRRAEVNQAHVEWRASPANLASLEEGLAERSTAAQSPEVIAWYTRAIAGIRGALAARRSLWREPDEDLVPAGPAEPSPQPLHAPVYMLTDGACGSACLDAADFWLKLGAVQIGRTTGADTLYMDVRQFVLPAGMTRAVVPMKVYRGRARGNNQPLVPVHAFTGDLRDTAAVERWMATLPGRASSATKLQ